MTVKRLVEYKHSLFTVDLVDTTGVSLINSKIYKGYYYAVKDDNLIALLDGYSVANDSRKLWYALKGERLPTANDIDCFNDDMSIK